MEEFVLFNVNLYFFLVLTIEADFGIESNMQINASIIVERIDSFRRALFQLVKTHHRVRDELCLFVDNRMSFYFSS